MFHVGMEHRAAEAMAAVGQQLAHPLRLQLLAHVANAGPCPFSELAGVVDATPAQVSNHLKGLRDAGLLVTQREGRQSLYRVENAYGAELLANLSAIVDPGEPVTGAARRPHSEARRCFDHIGGRLGVELLSALQRLCGLTGDAVDHGVLEPGPSAREVLSRFGIADHTVLLHGRRRFAYGCPDWTERTPHLGGAVAAEIKRYFEANGWVGQQRGSRALTVSPSGADALRELGLTV